MSKNLSAPGAPPINPAALEIIEAEKRADERRAREKQEKEQAAAVQEKAEEQAKLAAAREAIAKEELRAKVGPLRSELEKIVEHGRKDIEKRREQLQADEVTLGDLQGSIITAIELARTDPQRAIDTLNRAKDRLK